MSKKAKIEWIPWDQANVPAPQVRRGAHAMTKKVLNWSYCAKCGLMNLKNDATRRALRQECVVVE